MSLLEVRNLRTHLLTQDGVARAVDGVDLDIPEGEAVGVVGESGSGKSLLALSLLGLLPKRNCEVLEGSSVRFRGAELVGAGEKNLRRIRGREVAMVFQEPMTSLNPVYSLGNQIREALTLHRDMGRKDSAGEAVRLLEEVGIPDAAARAKAFPHQLSGGMRQRAMIAMALAGDPSLLVADEPTTALDVTIQARIFSLIKEMRQEKTSILLITHDMGVIWEMCDRVVVMYASRIAEEGSKKDIFERPAHPYTRGLLNSIPKLTADSGRLEAIPGQVPSPFNYPAGCHFRDRCPHAFDRCAQEVPPLMNLGGGHRAACWIADRLIHLKIFPTKSDWPSSFSSGK